MILGYRTAHKYEYEYQIIHSFRFRDNSVHVHEYSPFWVGIFIKQMKKKLAGLLFDMNILIEKALKHVY